MGLFDKLRPTKQEILGISLKIKAGSNPLPAPLVGAYVTAFSLAEEPQEATKQGVLAIFAMGYDVEEIIPQALHIRLSDWSTYVASAWPEFQDHFPSQSAIADRLADGGVVLSPLAGFEEAAR